MILIIDNYDSFTWNLYQLIGCLGFEATVKKHDEITVKDIRRMRPEKIIISPGPKKPEDAGISMEVVRELHQHTPILGVCLVHQCIGRVFGVDVIYARKVMHGKTSPIHHDGGGMFEGVKNPLTVARYHSLALSACPQNFILRAHTNDGEIMAIEHEKFPLHGVQFHPESFMTECGKILIKNFLKRHVH